MLGIISIYIPPPSYLHPFLFPASAYADTKHPYIWIFPAFHVVFRHLRTYFGRLSFEIQNDLIFPTSFVLKEKIIHTNKVICLKPDCMLRGVRRGKRTTQTF